MRLPRPYIPLRVRVQVAERQLRERCGYTVTNHKRDGKWLKVLLRELFADKPVELHHRPALCNRLSMTRGGVTLYNPPANDPDYLVYLPADEHDIETRVRGLHGQHSDLALARKRKRKERKAKRPKRKWPSRPFAKRARRFRK